MADGSNGVKMALNSPNRQMDLSKTRVLVPPFEADLGPHPHIVRGIEQLITQQLTETPGLEVSHYETVSPEKNPPCIDGEKECWRLQAWRTGAHKVVFGTVGKLEDQYVLNLKMIDSFTGKVERSVVGQPSGQNALRFREDVTALVDRLLGNQKRFFPPVVRQAHHERSIEAHHERGIETHHERDVTTPSVHPLASVPEAGQAEPVLAVRPEPVLSPAEGPVEGRNNPASFINWTAAIGFLTGAGAFGYGAYYGFGMMETEASFKTLANQREKKIVGEQDYSEKSEILRRQQWKNGEEMAKGLIAGGTLSLLSGILLYANHRTGDAGATPSLRIDIAPQKMGASFKLSF